MESFDSKTLGGRKRGEEKVEDQTRRVDFSSFVVFLLKSRFAIFVLFFMKF